PQAGSRLVAGASRVLAGAGVIGAFVGATSAIALSVAVAAVPLLGLFRAARGATATIALGAAETRFFAWAALVLLAYASLTNVDAVLARSVLVPDQAGAYGGGVALGKSALLRCVAVVLV